MSKLVTYIGTVYPWQCDHVGHMNVMWYVGKFDEATWTFFHHLGVTPTYLRQANRGMAAVQQTIQYRKELMAGDVLRVESQLLDMRDKVVRFVHIMMNVEEETPAAICELTGVHMDTAMRKSTPFPPAIREKAAALIAAAGA
ncbi:MAG: thioesterase family protein [Xanthobacteraceae bacterium]